jgi:SNF2 family DNA or RNA helicase
MIVLHAGFRERRLMVWAEHSDARPAAGFHPFDAGSTSLKAALAGLGVSGSMGADEIPLPSARGKPLPSTPLIAEIPDNVRPKLAPWKVTTAALEAVALIDLLSACAGKELLQPGLIAGADVAYWAAALRFGGALAFRQQFLPDLIHDGERFRARWRAAPVGRDDERRGVLVRAMPSAARAFASGVAASSLLAGFLDLIIDHLVRAGAKAGLQEAAAPRARVRRSPRRLGNDTVHDRWIAALYSRDGVVAGPNDDLIALEQQIREWRRPVAASTTAPFRVCFRLEEPEPDEDEAHWRVRYLLQARKDPSLLIPAAAAWNGKGDASAILKKAGFQPREHLLFSLGQASAISPHIEESLRAPAPAGYDLGVTEAHDFLTTTAMALEEAGFGVMLPAWWSRKGTKARVSARAHVKSAFESKSGLSLDSILNFEWQVSIGGERVSLTELRRLAALKSPLVRVRGQWVQMNADEIRAALDFWKNKEAGHLTAREAVSMALGTAKLPGAVEFEGVTAEGWFAALMEQLEGRAGFEQLPPPEGLLATLRPYQLRGYSWLAFVRRWGLGACLADDMGLGKTVQTLSLIQRDRREGVNRPVLLLCPTSVVGNWQKEAARFTPELPLMVHHGVGRTKGEEFVKQAAAQAMVVSSYALLYRDFEHLKQVPWAGIVLDEAQNVKNPETKQAVAARSLAADYRIALTGTPVENSVGDLWSIMEFLNPGLLGNRADFKRNFYMPIQTSRDPDAAARLKRITGPFILRRLKTDRSIISDLPEQLEMKVFCTLTKEQASLYAAVVKESIDAIENAEGIQRKGIVLSTLSRLKQVCNHPAQFLGDNSPLPGRSGKLSRLTEMMEEAISVGDRVLIFSQFAEMGEMIRRHLQETFGREALFLHGGVPKAQRDRMVERFQEEPAGPQVFVLSLKAGGSGLNLTRANHVFHFDRWWNPAVENQATDRAFRIGQKKNVQVHKFVCAGTMEEKIDEMIERKKDLAENVVGAGESWLTELSTAQLKDLFALSRGAVAE